MRQRSQRLTERRNLLTSITNTIKDYRAGEIPEPTPDHVDQWINQFEKRATSDIGPRVQTHLHF